MQTIQENTCTKNYLEHLKTEKIELIGTEKVYMSDVFINIDEETTLNAQSIILDKEKQKLVSLGDFTLSSKLGVLKGKDIDYDLTSETFVAKEVTFIDDLNSNYVKSESVSGSREYLDFENVIYTTCKPNEPGWTIQANYIRFYPENYGYGYNFRFFLHDFPLFYLPFMSFPTTTKRTTGFLAPSFSWLKSDEPKDNLGFRTELPYFINLGLDHDATVTLDLVQYRGIGLGFQYRYAFVENMFGQFAASAAIGDTQALAVFFDHIAAPVTNLTFTRTFRAKNGPGVIIPVAEGCYKFFISAIGTHKYLSGLSFQDVENSVNSFEYIFRG